MGLAFLGLRHSKLAENTSHEIFISPFFSCADLLYSRRTDTRHHLYWFSGDRVGIIDTADSRNSENQANDSSQLEGSVITRAGKNVKSRRPYRLWSCFASNTSNAAAFFDHC